MPQHGAFSIVANKQRDDLLTCQFRTQMDADGFIADINGFIDIKDLEQRRGLIYGLTPGVYGLSIPDTNEKGVCKRDPVLCSSISSIRKANRSSSEEGTTQHSR